MHWVGPGAAKKNLEEYEKYFREIREEAELKNKIHKALKEECDNLERTRARRALVKEKGSFSESTGNKRSFSLTEQQLRKIIREELNSFLSSLSIEQCRICGKEFLARPDQVDEYGAICEECYEGVSELAEYPPIPFL